MIVNTVIKGSGSAPEYYIEKSVDANGQLIPGSTFIDLSNVTSLSQNILSFAYANSTSLAGTIDFGSVRTIPGQSALSYCLQNCSNVSSINISKLEEITGSQALTGAFTRTSITSIIFSSLHTITGSQALQGCFSYCPNLTSVSFPALTTSSFGTSTNQFHNLLAGVTGCTIHFPSNLDPQGGSTVISSLSGYPNFSGTNTVLAYDLPATE